MTRRDAYGTIITAAAIYAVVLFVLVAARQIDHNRTVAAAQGQEGRP